MTLILLALALAMDSFAAALSQGASTRTRPASSSALRVGLAFGTAQAIMPLIGWALGLTFAAAIQDFDHWIAFAVLSLIGGHMMYSARKADDPLTEARLPLAGGWALFAAAVATSIDAAAVGVTLPALGQPVLLACAVIGIVTLAVSAAGVLVGRMAGMMAGRRAQLMGGLVLIGIGTKILVEHLYFGA